MHRVAIAGKIVGFTWYGINKSSFVLWHIDIKEAARFVISLLITFMRMG